MPNKSGGLGRSPAPLPVVRGSVQSSPSEGGRKRTASEASLHEDSYEASPRRSSRKAEERRRIMEGYKLAAPPSSSPYDRTHHFMAPMVNGLNGELYTSSQTRAALNREIESSSRIFPSLEDATKQGAWPAAALKLDEQARQKGTVRLEGRNRETGEGHDTTLTYIRTGQPIGGRTPSDTPNPGSPRPERKGARFERAHTAPYAFTGVPGHTVWVPTQANQVIDTHHERHAGTAGGRLFRQDTKDTSTLFSARPVEGGVEIRQSHYTRRL